MQARERQVFCNRTLNLRHVRAIGYDMDYTLVHYHADILEERMFACAFEHLQHIEPRVRKLEFIPDLMIRGLILDTELGNILKVNSFGMVKVAAHGTQMLNFDEIHHLYSRTIVNLREKRFVFLNTLFSLSESCLYAQLVDALDKGELKCKTYSGLYQLVRASVDQAHVANLIKSEVMKAPEKFVDADPDMPATLLEQLGSGKQLLLITNSDWEYSHRMLQFVFSPYLPPGMTFHDIFSAIFVSANKPAFFSDNAFLFETVGNENLLRPHYGAPALGKVYWGGDANHVEQMLGLSGDEILYIGDHIYVDVNVSKTLFRWRTALVLRELEHDIRAVTCFQQQEMALNRLMQQKIRLEKEISQSRLNLQYVQASTSEDPMRLQRIKQYQDEIQTTRAQVIELDASIHPLLQEAAQLNNTRWGLLMRAGNDKTHLARQLERHADIYMSRVSNLKAVTPYAYLRAQAGTLPHDLELMF